MDVILAWALKPVTSVESLMHPSMILKQKLKHVLLVLPIVKHVSMTTGLELLLVLHVLLLIAGNLMEHVHLKVAQMANTLMTIMVFVFHAKTLIVKHAILEINVLNAKNLIYMFSQIQEHAIAVVLLHLLNIGTQYLKNV